MGRMKIFLGAIVIICLISGCAGTPRKAVDFGSYRVTGNICVLPIILLLPGMSTDVDLVSDFLNVGYEHGIGNGSGTMGIYLGTDLTYYNAEYDQVIARSARFDILYYPPISMPIAVRPFLVAGFFKPFPRTDGYYGDIRCPGGFETGVGLCFGGKFGMVLQYVESVVSFKFYPAPGDTWEPYSSRHSFGMFTWGFTFAF